MITRQQVDVLRARWEEAVDAWREYADPTHPRYRNFAPTAGWITREREKRERLVQIARAAYDELTARFDEQERRAHEARTEELLRRRLEAEMAAARAAERKNGASMARAEGVSTTMNDKLNALQRKEAERLQILHAIYEMTDGNEHAAVAMHDVYDRVGVEYERGRPAMDYLTSEGLVLPKTTHRVSITHAGVIEAEQTIRQPSQPTAHFSPLAIHHVVTINGNVGAVQTGADAIANVQQNIGTTPERATALAQLDELANAVDDPAKREQATEYAQLVREETQKDAPNLKRIDLYIKGFTALVGAAPTLEHLAHVLLSR